MKGERREGPLPRNLESEGPGTQGQGAEVYRGPTYKCRGKRAETAVQGLR